METHITDTLSGLLVKYGMTIDDLILQGYKYCGGNYDGRLKYFKLVFPGERLPEKFDECVCTESIVRNCYICDKDNQNLLIIGSCCIKQFLPKERSGKTCEICK